MNWHFPTEDVSNFPYSPPSTSLVQNYQHIFTHTCQFPDRVFKSFADILIAAFMLVLSAPLWLAVTLAIWVDGLVHATHSGTILDPYIAVSSGKKFLKLKFRTLIMISSDRSWRRLDFRFRLSENENKNLTCVGRILQKYYLDELPQILNVMRGEMSLVGPRPLAWHHYVRIIKLGHPLRKWMKAGLFGPTHVRKGSVGFPDLTLEYEYADLYMRLSALRLIFEDCKVMARGIKCVLGGGRLVK